jgi:ankyrin repeat protein
VSTSGIVKLFKDVSTFFKKKKEARLIELFGKKSNSQQLKEIEKILESGISPNLADKKNKSLIMLAIETNDLNTLKLLLKYDADFSIKTNDEFTPLAFAVNKGFDEIVGFLLDNGADLTTDNNDVFALAVLQDNEDIVKTLIKKGANLHTNDYLCIAVSRGYFDIVKVLVENGCDIHKRNGYNELPIDIAEKNDYQDIVDLLVAEGAFSVQQLVHAIEECDTDKISLLLKTAPDFDITLLNDKIIWAAKEGRIEILKLLIDAGGNVNAKNEDGLTALMWASAKGYADIVMFLINAGADVNTESCSGWTALMSAADRGSLNVVKILVEKSADIHKTTHEGGMTALMEAAISGQLDVVKYLVENGANVHQTNTAGDSPISMSVMTYPAVADFLDTVSK